MSEQDYSEIEDEESMEEVDEQGIEESSSDSRYEMLESKLSSLEETNNQLLQYLQSQSKQQETRKPEYKMSPEQAAQFASNPEALASFIQEQAAQASQQIAVTSARTEWDSKAKKEFPIDSDVKFQKAVLSEMRDLINNGEFSRNSPTLMYRAAQIASMKYRGAGKPKQTRTEKPTSISSSGNAHTENVKSDRSKISDDDPRVRAYLMFKENPTKEDIANYKKKLESGTLSRHERRPRGRTLSR